MEFKEIVNLFLEVLACTAILVGILLLALAVIFMFLP